MPIVWRMKKMVDGTSKEGRDAFQKRVDGLNSMMALHAGADDFFSKNLRNVHGHLADAKNLLRDVLKMSKNVKDKMPDVCVSRFNDAVGQAMSTIDVIEHFIGSAVSRCSYDLVGEILAFHDDASKKIDREMKRTMPKGTIEDEKKW